MIRVEIESVDRSDCHQQIEVSVIDWVKITKIKRFQLLDLFVKMIIKFAKTYVLRSQYSTYKG